MAIFEKSKFFNSPKADSRIKSANVQISEQWIGFFASPMLMYMAYYAMSTTYLNQFYVDVVKIGSVAGGMFLVLLPILSKVADAITNLLMGVIVDRTKTRQGKARPWVLISGPLIAITGILLYAVPQMSTTAQAIWIGISYNLYFAFAFTMYNMSQSLLAPLSTRNTKQRDGLAMMLSMGQNMLPGALIYIIIPLFVLPYLGVARERWTLVMSIISILAIPGTLLQYFFTKERVSEDAVAADIKPVPLLTQIKTCFTDKYWLIYFGILFTYQLGANLYSASLNFYANWVLGTYNDGITLTLLNSIGQLPLGLGIFLLWPLARKFGKRAVFTIGMAIAAIGSFGVFLIPNNLGAVLGCFTIKSIGLLPTYLFMAVMAEGMDHIEWARGYRCDGFTATMNSVLLTVMAGVGTTIFNSGLHQGTATGYVPPAEDGSWIAQTVETQNWFVVCVALIPAICFLICAVIFYFYDIEKIMPRISSDIVERYRKEAEARGEVYYSAEEKAAMEQAENDRIAEEDRIKELKEKCEKKGLNFDEEEAKYQAKLAEKKAKLEAKAKAAEEKKAKKKK